ncbi:hypothetical protein [Geoglobus acetivorans]|uniref:ArnR1-like winged helix-turn-helix domain-containing protein n=1 Tax=Geoglobus acetivorans TaxID=565033 RepID=A0A0A7GBN1_GEOAI|nr:hypothetical protein GACE_0377 [Geoglobus acetivorans]
MKSKIGEIAEKMLEKEEIVIKGEEERVIAELLEFLGLIEKHENGLYRVTEEGKKFLELER